MGEPVWEYRMRREYRGERTPEHVIAESHLGYEERAARVKWEQARASFVVQPDGDHPDAVVRIVFEARKVVKWNELEDTTPMYARGEEDGETSAPTS